MSNNSTQRKGKHWCSSVIAVAVLGGSFLPIKHSLQEGGEAHRTQEVHKRIINAWKNLEGPPWQDRKA